MEGKRAIQFSKKEILIICIASLILSFVAVLVLYSGTYSPAQSVPSVASSTSSNGAEKENLIRVFSLKAGDAVTSPLRVEGEARGNWFFEASFPIRVLDGDGGVIGLGIAEAKEEWMTEDFVPFEAVIEFFSPRFSTGTLVLEKDNPSGLPEHADELRIPVIFSNSKPSADGTVKESCYIGGCSSQICSDKEGVVSICDFRPEYSCYKNARCERQSSGECGWMPTAELQACIKNPPPFN
ncbi:MAG: Gmad2 immunoglobulin-like domain-containing protein [Patescibacteria group bacterium]